MLEGATEDDTIPHHAVVARELTRILVGNKESFDLVVLSGCATTQSGNRRSLQAGLASSLLKAGVRAVIGMPANVDDKAALHFSEHLYRALAFGYSLDQAVTIARLEVGGLAQGGQYWGRPALYVRSPEAIVFTAAKQPTSNENIARLERYERHFNDGASSTESVGDSAPTPEPNPASS